MTLLWVLAALLIAIGFAGLVIPGLPGTPLVFAGLLAAAWADGFQKVGWPTLILLAILTALSLLVDFAAGLLGIQRTGASRLALVGAAVGSLVGLFLGIPGLLLGPFVGAVVGELLARKDWKQAGRAGLGAWLGFILGTLTKLALCFAMLGLFVLSYLL